MAVKSGNPDLVIWLINHGCVFDPLPTLDATAELSNVRGLQAARLRPLEWAAGRRRSRG